MSTHSRRAGDTIYPVDEGIILKLQTPRSVFNPHINAVCEHDVYVWIMKLLRGRGGHQPKHRPVRIFEVQIPRIPDVPETAFLGGERYVQKQTIGIWVKKYGADVVARRVYFHDVKRTFRNFYIAIGVLKIDAVKKPRKRVRRTM